MIKLKINLLLLILSFILLSTTVQSQNDCIKAITVCGNTGFQGLTAVGVGVQELNASNNCQSEENNSIWLRLPIGTSGTLGFTLTPSDPAINEDFDFFIFGPSSNCNALGQSIRCSTTNPQASGQTDNTTGMNDTATDTSEGPGPAGNGFVKSLDVLAGEIYYLVIDRPIGNSDFAIVWNGTAKFIAPPIISTLTATALDLDSCDNDGVQDDKTPFNLSLNDSQIRNSQTNVAVTYHLNSNDVTLGINPILNPTSFVNTENPQLIYGRLTSNTDCFATVPFEIFVNSTIDIPNDESAICDDVADGNDANGRATFNLAAVSQDLFGAASIAGLSFAYYLNLADATAEQNVLPQSYYNATPNLQNVIIVVKNTNGCKGTKSISLKVNPLPSKINYSLTQCDTVLNPDGLATFNLAEADNAISVSNANVAVAYYLDNANAAANVPLNKIYTNVNNPQILISKITNLTTGCSSFSTLQLIVNLVVSQNIAPLQTCDLLNQEDGFAPFNLSNAAIVLAPTQIASYYSTLDNALLEINPIVNVASYTNLVAYNDSFFVRIETNNQCSGITTVGLVVNKLPVLEVKSTQDYVVCTNKPSEFITIDAALTSGNPINFTYKWFLNGVAIAPNTYSINVNVGGSYTVEVYTADNCYKTRTIAVKQSGTAVIADLNIAELTINDNTVIVNLTQTPNIFVYSIDQPQGPFQNYNKFTNVSSGIHTVYVSDTNGCGVVSRQFAILGFPDFFTPNGDSINDIWSVDGQNSTYNRNTKVSIFDRYGQLLKEIAPKDLRGWDGTFNNQPMPADDYWYVVVLENGLVIKNHFTLKR